MSYAIKYCKDCGRRLKANSHTYAIETCTKCINTLAKYSDLRRTMQAKRFKRYYERHAEKERARASENYKKKKELKE